MSVMSKMSAIRGSLVQARLALSVWSMKQVWVSAGVAVGVGLLIGIGTVLIPNSVFTREIAPVWWNYPVWILTSIASGMLAATYVKSSPVNSATATDAIATGADGSEVKEQPEQRRAGRMGLAGTFLTWFAVGCPVCNKLALLALGYSGAITWFAPVQPYLALISLVMLVVAVMWRLKGQISCTVSPKKSSQVMQRVG